MRSLLGIWGWIGNAPTLSVHQHDWQSADALVILGTIPASEIEMLSKGLLSEDVSVTINLLVLDADRILIVNPVFPHEVVGFSGGYKYFFPGVSGEQIVNTSYWLGALITNSEVNGKKNAPVHTLIERAADWFSTPRQGLAFVMRGHDPVGVFFGEI